MDTWSHLMNRCSIFNPVSRHKVHIFHEVSQDDTILDMAGNILLPVPWFHVFLPLSYVDMCKAIFASEAVGLTCFVLSHLKLIV